MEEVDKIIIQSLVSIGCELTPEIQRISQLDQEMFIESVAKLLNTINPSSESLPTKLPPNTGVKFRICSKFAAICQQIGYKNEIGYQTFLYLNETDMRRLLMFLVEKLTKDVTSSGTDSELNEISSDKSKSFSYLISQAISQSLNQFWLPPYCKTNSLRIQENNKFTKEGCQFITNINTLSLSYPKNYVTDKSKYSPEAQKYFENHCQFITEQIIRKPVDLLASLIQENTIERLKEQALLKDSIKERKRIEANEKSIQEFKAIIRDCVKKADQMHESSGINKNSSALTMSDLADIEAAIQMNFKSPTSKGSRFTHSENLQFSKDENKNVSVTTSLTEEKKEEEIKILKEKLDNLNKVYDELIEEIHNLNALIEKMEDEFNQQTEKNKQLDESIHVKQKTINLINDAPMNILRLKEEINNHEKKMQNLDNQWNVHKKPLEEEIDSLKQDLNNKRAQMQQKIEDTKKIRNEIDMLNSDLSLKEDLIKELNKEMESIPKESIKTSNRQFYTKRILEIVANIDKQKKEIEKILIETKTIQKEINQLTGKLERIFNSSDELLFKDAKKDETNKKVYKLFININDSYEQLIKTIEETSHIEREIRDLEDQVNSESQNKIADNLEMVAKDYKQIKEENEQITAKLKSTK